MNNGSEFHWAEGMKYVLEGIKGLLILNGAAAVSILTFIGNTEAHSNLFVIGMICFALGAAMAPLALWCAYETQLSYGNAASSAQNTRDYARAGKFHNITRWCAGLGFLMFLVGMLSAALGLWANT